MECVPRQYAWGLSEEERVAVSEVAAAMRMTADEFLTNEVHGTTSAEARRYMTAFAAYATDSQVRTIYYLTRALTEKRPT